MKRKRKNTTERSGNSLIHDDCAAMKRSALKPLFQQVDRKVKVMTKILANKFGANQIRVHYSLVKQGSFNNKIS